MRSRRSWINDIRLEKKVQLYLADEEGPAPAEEEEEEEGPAPPTGPPT